MNHLKNGDYVARCVCGILMDGVHLVTNLSDDGLCADFVCVVAPASGYIGVGEVEYNICSRYGKIDYSPAADTKP